MWAGKLKKSNYGLWKLAITISGKTRAVKLLTGNEPSRHVAEEIASTMRENITFEPFQFDLDNAPHNSENWKISFSTSGIAKCLKSLPKNKASGADNIPNQVYALLSDFIATRSPEVNFPTFSVETGPADRMEGGHCHTST